MQNLSNLSNQLLSERFIKTRKGLLFIVLALSNFLYLNVSSAEAYTISARSAIVIDIDKNEIVYSKNPHYKQPPASTAKLLTAMVVLDRLHPNHIVEISENAASTAYTGGRLRKGDTFTVKSLLYLLLMKSVNGAGVALAEEVAGTETSFVKLMNAKAGNLGLNESKFINASGLPGDGQYVTAYDLARIMRSALRYPLVRTVISTKTKNVTTLEGREIHLQNTNKLLWQDEDFLGGKTGYTSAAMHCLTFAMEKGTSTLVAAILGEPNRSKLWQTALNVVDAKHQTLINEETIKHTSTVKSKKTAVSSKKNYSSKKKSHSSKSAKTVKAKTPSTKNMASKKTTSSKK
ncbi:D-alanyl-D-alanine carboxypeptidase [Candidatus Magnetoovum chiemensis]|nr:D-alanyl-D-alanine carboxypeptidase [Candidatus Magnetoovum chiemensis]